MLKKTFFICSFLLFSACTTSTPKNVNNVCNIFIEKENWYSEINDAQQKWGLPIHVTLAIIHQESRFVADAQPPRPWLLGIIPWFRSSSAFGYAQAQDGTWDDYLSHPESIWSADRDNFADACDFIGWYCSISHKKLNIAKNNTKELYLAYHEGHTGYRKKSYLKKPWLLKISKKVANNAKRFKSQLSSCENELQSKSWFFW